MAYRSLTPEERRSVRKWITKTKAELKAGDLPEWKRKLMEQWVRIREKELKEDRKIRCE
jgi:hypothetical protein